MAVTRKDIEKGIEILRESGARKVLIFGSAADNPDNARDLDLACEGVAPENFLLTVGRLLDELSISVDLIDLSNNNPFVDYVRRHGKVIYEG
jgi:predicted nucleotidyltransferase